MKSDAVLSDLWQDYGSGSPWPGLSNDGWSFNGTGFWLPQETGWYAFQCLTTSSTRAPCSFTLNGQALTRGYFNASQPVPFSILVANSWSSIFFRMQRSQAFSNESLFNVSTAIEKGFITLPSHELTHDVACAQACLNGGCCMGNDVCGCPVGFAGPLCEEQLPGCAANASTVLPSAIVRYFRTGDRTELLLTETMTSLSKDWGHSAPAANVPEDYFGVAIEAFFQPTHTGWHSFQAIVERMELQMVLDGIPLTPMTGSITHSAYLFAENAYAMVVQGRKSSTSSASFTINVRGPGQYYGVIDQRHIYHRSGPCGCLPCNMTAINRYAPTFTAASLLPIALLEDEPAGRVRTLTGYDQDFGDGYGLQYQLVSDFTQAFTVDVTTGSLSLSQPLNRSKGVNGSLVVMVLDSGTPSKNSTASISMTINCRYGYTGDLCDVCGELFGGPNCELCDPCIASRGVCGLGGRCYCNTNFAGDACADCADKLYGQDCTALPWAVSVAPASGDDRGNTVVTVVLHNVQMNSTLTCRFGTEEVNATTTGMETIQCRTPRAVGKTQNTQSVSMSIFSNGVKVGGDLRFGYVGACSTTDCPQDRADCLYGTCSCRCPHYGSGW